MTTESRGNRADGQAQQLPNISRDAALHNQIYRYAEDLQLLVEDKSSLAQRYNLLEESYRQLRGNCLFLDNLVQSSQDIHLTTTPDGTILQCNAAASLIAPLLVMVGRSLRSLIISSHRADFDNLLALVRQTREAELCDKDFHLNRDDLELGTLIVTARLVPIVKDGVVDAIHWIFRDFTRIREAEFDSELSTMVFQSASEGIFITDLKGDVLSVNPAFSCITGYTAAEVIGRNPRFLKSGVQDDLFYQKFWKELSEKGRWQGKLFNRKKSGEIYAQWLSVTSVAGGDGTILSYIAVFSDMSRLLEAEEKIAYIASHDSVTGLPNRLLLIEKLDKAIVLAKNQGSALSIVFIDINGLKKINYTLGFKAGDHVLKKIANRLQPVVRESDTLGQIDGDDFFIIANGLSDSKETEELADKIEKLLTQPFSYCDKEISVTCVIGSAQLLENMGAETLLRNAYNSMFLGKKRG